MEFDHINNNTIKLKAPPGAFMFQNETRNNTNTTSASSNNTASNSQQLQHQGGKQTSSSSFALKIPTNNKSSNNSLRKSNIFTSARATTIDNDYASSNKMMSQSFGAAHDPSPIHYLRARTPPAPSSNTMYRYSSVGTGSSSVTYSGYLYKRSNYPHRTIESPTQQRHHEQQDDDEHDHTRQHSPQHHNIDSSSPQPPFFVIDPFNVPEFPDLRQFHTVNESNTARTTTIPGSSQNSRTSSHNTYHYVTDHQWPDFQSPLSDQEQQVYEYTYHHQQQQSTSTMAVVTPSPVYASSNDCVQQQQTTETFPGTSSETITRQAQPQQQERNKEGEKNPIQQGLDAAAAFFGKHFGGDSKTKDAKPHDGNKETIHDSSTPTSSKQIHSFDSASPPRISSNLPPITSAASSLPIKMVRENTSSNTVTSNTLLVPTARRPIPIPGSEGKIHRTLSPSSPPPTTRTYRQQSFQDANHRRHSAPIDMMKSSQNNIDTNSSTSSTILHNAISDSHLDQNDGDDNGPPQDFYDPKDGHLWRAKYCVLEDGVLYFYRNANDGQSIEAALERKSSKERNDVEYDSHDDHHDNDYLYNDEEEKQHQRCTTPDESIIYGNSKGSLSTATMSMSKTTTVLTTAGFNNSSTTDASSSSLLRRRSSAKDLSKSPMMRPLMHHFDSSGDSDSGPCMWEKRVFMDCVGGVRTAEQQYGSNSFELVAMDDEDFDQSHMDTLVLQARNSDEMKEWIFQFHRSLASFMRNIMDVFGSTSSSGAFLDIHHPSSLVVSRSSQHPPPPHPVGSIPHSPSEKQLHRLLAMSPRFHHGTKLPMQQTLSHGHGRSSLRRRADLKRTPSESASLSSTPETRDTVSPHHQFAFQEPSPNSTHLTPQSISPPSQFQIPPPTSGTAAGIHDNRTTITPVKDLDIGQPEFVPPKPQSDVTPVVKSTKYIAPHVRRHQESKTKTYVAPHKRNHGNAEVRAFSSTAPFSPADASNTSLPLAERAQLMPSTATRHGSPNLVESTVFDVFDSKLDTVDPFSAEFVRGGCADPQLIQGSILDSIYIPRKASRVGKQSSVPFGSYGGGQVDADKSRDASNCPAFHGNLKSLRWETGAVSECGIRDSNEDAFLITNDLLNAFMSGSSEGLPKATWATQDDTHTLGLFAIFDGHLGNHGARFAVERLGRLIYEQLLKESESSAQNDFRVSPAIIESALHDAIITMDEEFCSLCQEDGREWDSGATALVAVIADGNLVIANLGDCRGVLCRFVDDTEFYEAEESWVRLEDFEEDIHFSDRSKTKDNDAHRCFWKEVTSTHTPSVSEERERIEKANGWITTETEIPIAQLRRIDFLDEDVVEILKRCMHYPVESKAISNSDSERSTKECRAAPQRILHISRVCGELGVSRALGDRDFKAAFNMSPSENGFATIEQEQHLSATKSWWDCPLALLYPADHNRRFQYDLVTNVPEFQRIKLREIGVSDEFLLLACDGLWDIMDTDDAVRIVRDLLFRKKWTAKKSAARLAEIAIHLGSSDNITVIVVRLFSRGEE